MFSSAVSVGIEINTEERGKTMQQMFGRTPARVQGILDGIGYTFKVPGDLEVSVVRHRGSYGGPQGLWEAATFDATGSASDVEGWLTEDEVSAYIAARES